MHTQNMYIYKCIYICVCVCIYIYYTYNIDLCVNICAKLQDL